MTEALLLLTGPTRAGKTTLAAALCAAHPAWRRVVSCTTRPPRPGEEDGVDYHFLSRGAFADARLRGGFVECQQAYGGDWYGVRLSDLRVAIVNPEGVAFYRGAGLRVQVVRVEVPLPVLRVRLAQAGLTHRLSEALREHAACRTLEPDLVVRADDDLDRAIRAVEQLVGRAFPSSLNPSPTCP